MTDEMIKKQHETALAEGQRYARQHGQSLTEEVSYGRGFKAGSNWYRNNIWHKSDVKPNDLSWVLIKFPGAVIEKGYYDAKHDTVVIGMDSCSWSSITQWCYIEDIEPDVPEDFDDVDPKHLVHQHEDESNKFILKFSNS